MDYRDTEDFARRMSDAEERAMALREQAVDDLFTAAARKLRALWQRLRHDRNDHMLPEA
jgi:hypothetical protein